MDEYSLAIEENTKEFLVLFNCKMEDTHQEEKFAVASFVEAMAISIGAILATGLDQSTFDAIKALLMEAMDYGYTSMKEAQAIVEGVKQ